MKVFVMRREITLSILMMVVVLLSVENVGYSQAVCQVGDIIQPGESCTYPGTDAVFSVDDAGRARFLFFTAGGNLNIDGNINGKPYNLVTEHSEGGGRRIIELAGDTAPADDETPIDPGDDETILIPDPNLAAAIRQKIGDSITRKTLLNLTGLDAPNSGITDLTGLEHARNLEWLYIQDNNISDISPLAGLTQLTELWLSDNSISDISPLAGLTQLTYLALSSNTISDVSPLAGLTQLTRLFLPGNTISDVSPLAGLTQLTWLGLSSNTISDIAPLANLTKLEDLQLFNNSISDVSPLVKLNLRGTEGNSMRLWIQLNPLSYASINTHIPAMQARGIEVLFDTRVPTRLVKISGFAQQGVVNTALPLPFVAEVQDEQNRPFAGVPVTFTITAGSGKLSPITTITDATGKASAYLTLGQTVGTTTVRVSTTNVSQPVQFTATALPRSAPAPIPDPNLRAKIAEALGNPPGETITFVDMLKLRTLTANNASIFDLRGLQFASNLTSLSLNDNSISDVTPLTGLAHLQRLDLIGNPLSDTALQTHLPLLQAAGVNVRFDERTLAQSRPIVRLIYFRPRDRQPQPDINAKMDALIKEAQQTYAGQMNHHGFGRKTFQFETNARGNAVVYHVIGEFEDTYYHDQSWNVWGEIEKQFDIYNSKDIYLVALDVSSERIGIGGGPACGQSILYLQGYDRHDGGYALIPASGVCFNSYTAVHELGHTFGLDHDLRNNTTTNSLCAAEWLDVHPAFNPSQPDANKEPTFEMLPPSLAAPPNAIQLRFKVTDPDGLHQVQLRTTATLLDCKSLNGKSSATVEFVTTLLTPKNKSVYLSVIDVNGNFTASQAFPVDVTSLLPPSKVVSIPDPNLAAAIRQEIGDDITTQTLLNLTRFYAVDRGITDLTGLEHAHNLRELRLGSHGEEKVNSNTISDFSPIAGLPQLTSLTLINCGLSDVSLLSGLTQLTWLYLPNNNISDVAPLAGLTKLRSLDLYGNSISDISPLAGLTKLTGLGLESNSISDISPLAGLTKLTKLDLQDNSISDVAPLAGLTKLRSLNLYENIISDIAPLANLTQLTELHLWDNAISDISPLTELKKLTRLSLSRNNISDISALVGLTQLTELGLGGNSISDISPLAGLTKLTYLGLWNNTISDVSPLVKLNLTGRELWGSIGLAITSNPLSSASINTHIPAMQARGIEVRFDDNQPTVTAARPVGDVNEDGIINIQDLVLVASSLGQTGESSADVNGDGVVNIQDLVLVAGAFGEGASAAPTLHPSDLEGLTAAEVQNLLTQARQIALTDPAYLRGIAVLEQLLALLLPKETALLPNYPNPFNPETWIPYQLAKTAEVTITIYGVNGHIVRELPLGHQPAGMYQNRSRAAYWDGRNALGESVASGVYFYTLTAGDFSATRKMLIRK